MKSSLKYSCQEVHKKTSINKKHYEIPEGTFRKGIYFMFPSPNKIQF